LLRVHERVIQEEEKSILEKLPQRPKPDNLASLAAGINARTALWSSKAGINACYALSLSTLRI
jgi:hypothetical protein